MQIPPVVRNDKFLKSRECPSGASGKRKVLRLRAASPHFAREYRVRSLFASGAGGVFIRAACWTRERLSIEPTHWQRARNEWAPRYWIELAADEKTLLALVPISRMVPTTITKMTASITAYSAMSWPRSSDRGWHRSVKHLLVAAYMRLDRETTDAKHTRGRDIGDTPSDLLRGH